MKKILLLLIIAAVYTPINCQSYKIRIHNDTNESLTIRLIRSDNEDAIGLSYIKPNESRETTDAISAYDLNAIPLTLKVWTGKNFTPAPLVNKASSESEAGLIKIRSKDLFQGDKEQNMFEPETEIKTATFYLTKPKEIIVTNSTVK